MSKAMKYLKQIDKRRSASSAALSPLGRFAPPTKPVYVAHVPIPTIDWADACSTDPVQDLRDARQLIREYDLIASWEWSQRCLEYAEKRIYALRSK